MNYKLGDNGIVSDIGFIPLDPNNKDYSQYLAWVNQGGSAESAISLDDLKVKKNNEINTARLAANRSYFMYAGKQIACDDLSRGDIDGTNAQILNIGGLPPGWPGGWKAIDNSIVLILSVADWKTFYAAMYSQGMANFSKSQNLKAQLAAATTPEEVAAISW